METDNRQAVDIRLVEGVAVVSFSDSSISSAKYINAAAECIKGYLAENGPVSVVFDFAGVKFFASQVLGLLLDIRGRLKATGAEVAVSAIQPQLYRVFKITSLERIFRFFPDSETAVKAVKDSTQRS